MRFVKESGLSALASPPTQGFSLLGWVMPFVGILLRPRDRHHLAEEVSRPRTPLQVRSR